MGVFDEFLLPIEERHDIEQITRIELAYGPWVIATVESDCLSKINQETWNIAFFKRTHEWNISSSSLRGMSLEYKLYVRRDWSVREYPPIKHFVNKGFAILAYWDGKAILVEIWDYLLAHQNTFDSFEEGLAITHQNVQQNPVLS